MIASPLEITLAGRIMALKALNNLSTSKERESGECFKRLNISITADIVMAHNNV